MTPRSAATLLVAALTLAGACAGSGSESSSGTGSAAAGETAYQANCARCHGANLDGTGQGPPFLSPIYAPNHHADAAFQAAAKNGVKPHHWNFGPMPPVPAVDEQQIADIVAYVRAKQAAAGITHDPSHP